MTHLVGHTNIITNSNVAYDLVDRGDQGGRGGGGGEERGLGGKEERENDYNYIHEVDMPQPSTLRSMSTGSYVVPTPPDIRRQRAAIATTREEGPNVVTDEHMPD